MSTGMYIVTGFAMLVGISALVFSWRAVQKFSAEKPTPPSNPPPHPTQHPDEEPS